VLATNKEIKRAAKPAFSLEDFVSGKVAPNPGWLKEVGNKWPGDETIQELLAALDDALIVVSYKRLRGRIWMKISC